MTQVTGASGEPVTAPTTASSTEASSTEASSTEANQAVAGPTSGDPPAGSTSSYRQGVSLSRRLSLSFALLGTLMVLALCGAGWAYYSQVHARGHVINVVDRARLEAQSLLSDYINEETGVRGYILSGDKSFLQPYSSGVSNARGDGKKLGVLERRDPRSYQLLSGVDDAVHKWQHQFALPAIANTAKGGHIFAAKPELELGKADFNGVRGRFDLLYGALDASAASSMATLNDSQDAFIAVAIVLVLLLTGAGAAAAWALRDWVTRPLGRLQADVREVAGGQLAHSVVPSGPPELADLARDVEIMRQRIVTEVDLLAEASAGLREVNADLSRSNQELEQFAYVASHDLQEPLRKVVGFCELLNHRYSDQLDEKAQEYISFAVDGATRMQVLINDLLGFSRVGRDTSQFEAVRLGDAFDQALVNLAAAIADKEAVVSSERLPTVRGDPALMTALFQNLIGNAVKFSKDDPPEVNVSAKREGATWVISVTDNGIGIEPRFADRVFVIFQRLHGRDEYTGTGIGLAMCKKIVEFHGGRVWLDTGYSLGTRICLTLPVIGANL